MHQNLQQNVMLLCATIVLRDFGQAEAKFSVEIMTFTAIDPTDMQTSWPWIALPYNDALDHVRDIFNETVNFTQTYLSDASFKTCDDMTAWADYLVADHYYRRRYLSNMTLLLYSDNETLNLNRLAAGTVLIDYWVSEELSGRTYHENQFTGWNTLMLTSTVATDINLQREGLAPTWVTSSILTYNGLQNFVVDVLLRFEWRSIYTILDKTKFSNPWFVGARDAVVQVIRSRVYNSQIYYGVYYGDDHGWTFLPDVKKSSRIVMYFGMTENLRTMMAHAAKLDMTNGEYVYLAFEPYPDPSWGNFSWLAHDPLDQILEQAWRSLLLVTLADTELERKKKLKSRFPIWRERAKAFYYFDLPPDAELNFSQMSAYESILIFGQVLRDALKERPIPDFSNGTDFARRFHNRTVHIATGSVQFSPEGNRCVDLVLRDYNSTAKHWEAVIYYSSVENSMRQLGEIEWFNRNSSPPNEPPCGFSGGLGACSEPVSSIGLTAGMGFLGLIVLGFLLLAAGRWYFNRKAEEELARRWDLNSSGIWNPTNFSNNALPGYINHPEPNVIVMFPVKKVVQIQDIEGTFLSLSSWDSWLASKDLDVKLVKKTFGGHRIYNGQHVWITEVILKERFLKPPKKCSLLMTALVGLRHQNVNPFIGMCSDLQRGAILLLDQYNVRGSLHDYIATGRLNYEIRSSFVQDVIYGLRFLHQSAVKRHGILTSYSCLVDNRFVVKLAKTRYRSLMQHFRNLPKPVWNFHKDSDVYWTAPEALQDTDGTIHQKNDIFALAVIMNEIYTGKCPYNDEKTEVPVGSTLPQEVYKKVIARDEPPFRPYVDANTVPGGLVNIIKKCWHNDPDQRPTIMSAQNRAFRQLEISASDTLITRMLASIQRYAAELEDKVHERTIELMVEQRKCDDLIQEMLPKSIAAKLRMNEVVQASFFEVATCYFSDIVGFVDFSATATPLEVIKFLNAVYSTFDRVLPLYDVYKLETINDGYVVASGLPVPNNGKHVTEIAAMACSLMDVYKVAHFRQETLLRIGIHSGPVAAGVVGKKCPRYCIFGDTVNTASRMESHGEAGKIHLSEQTASLLRPHSVFLLAPRGETAIKGKGLQMTFWLEGSTIPHRVASYSDRKPLQKFLTG